MEIGLYTFGELTPHWTDGRRIGAEQRLREVLAAAKLADAAGLDVFALGEHHRLDFAIAATPVVLAAIAQVTARVRLASAVTILPTADPVRVFEDFATVDLLSGGRAEVIAGRGVFTELEQGLPEGTMRLQEACRVSRTLGQPHELFSQITRGREHPAALIEAP